MRLPDPGVLPVKERTAVKTVNAIIENLKEVKDVLSGIPCTFDMCGNSLGDENLPLCRICRSEKDVETAVADLVVLDETLQRSRK